MGVGSRDEVIFSLGSLEDFAVNPAKPRCRGPVNSGHQHQIRYEVDYSIDPANPEFDSVCLMDSRDDGSRKDTSR